MPRCTSAPAHEIVAIVEGQATARDVFIAIDPERAWNTRRVAGARVLVIDDEEDAREMMRAFLGLAGMGVHAATGVGDAVGALARFAPDVVICDLAMPDEDGYSFMRRFRARRDFQHVPVVALTTSTSRTEREAMLRAGFAHYVAKPADPHLLVDLLAKLVRDPQPG